MLPSRLPSPLTNGALFSFPLTVRVTGNAGRSDLCYLPRLEPVSPSFARDVYLDSAADLLGLDIGCDRAAVAGHFHRLARIADDLEAFPLPPDLEAAPVFTAAGSGEAPAIASPERDRADE